MKKKRIWIPVILFAAYVLVIAVDCGRLNTGEARKPLITLQSEETEFRKRYTGLGYTVQYYLDEPLEGITEVGEENVYGAEFRLLDTILIWGWVI